MLHFHQVILEQRLFVHTVSLPASKSGSFLVWSNSAIS